MKELDPGHLYALTQLDDNEDAQQLLRFVKRIGPMYPGNVGPPYAGTNMQEVLRALIARCRWVNNQIPAPETERAIELLQHVLWLFEHRAARRHNRELSWDGGMIETAPVCPKCGHIGCEEVRH